MRSWEHAHIMENVRMRIPPGPAEELICPICPMDTDSDMGRALFSLFVHLKSSCAEGGRLVVIS